MCLPWNINNIINENNNNVSNVRRQLYGGDGVCRALARHYNVSLYCGRCLWVAAFSSFDYY